MMRSCRDYPFNRLTLPVGETTLFQADNLTFHRSIHYGVAVTASAVYWYSPFSLLLGRWKRYSLEMLVGARFVDARWFPSLVLQAHDRTHTLWTLHDTYDDEKQYDRLSLEAAAKFIEKQLSVSALGSVGRTGSMIENRANQ